MEEIIASRDLEHQSDARWLASVYFKNSINRYWKIRRDSLWPTYPEFSVATCWCACFVTGWFLFEFSILCSLPTCGSFLPSFHHMDAFSLTYLLSHIWLSCCCILHIELFYDQYALMVCTATSCTTTYECFHFVLEVLLYVHLLVSRLSFFKNVVSHSNTWIWFLL